VINPPLCPGIDLNPKTLKAQTSIQIALTLENIWSVRNQRVHNNTKVNHLSIVKNLEGRILEHFHIIDPSILVDSFSISPLCWSTSPSNVVKLNTDAALKDGKATLAVVAKDDTGTIINCWAKHYPTSDPCTAESAMLLWALKLVRDNHFYAVVVESDAKVCIEALTVDSSTTSWKIHSLVANINFLALEFSSCVFCWVRRDANGVAHALAKFASSQPTYFSCTSSNLSLSLREAWLGDLLALPS
jgi:hypothetical protein